MNLSHGAPLRLMGQCSSGGLGYTYSYVWSFCATHFLQVLLVRPNAPRLQLSSNLKHMSKYIFSICGFSYSVFVHVFLFATPRSPSLKNKARETHKSHVHSNWYFPILLLVSPLLSKSFLNILELFICFVPASFL